MKRYTPDLQNKWRTKIYLSEGEKIRFVISDQIMSLKCNALDYEKYIDTKFLITKILRYYRYF